MAKEQGSKQTKEAKQARAAKYDPRKTKDRFGARVRGWWRNASRYELASLAATPVIFLLVFFQHDLGVPVRMGGYGFIFLVYYCGYFFLMLLILDRRLDNEYIRLGRGMRRQKIADIQLREDERRVTNRQAATTTERNEAAMERGRQKAAEQAARGKGKAE